ncbi:hypothetical protein [Geothrix sp. 21YS21S-2]|uniref:hypothetical protein n=1 Tax=Geothrix sp. 21YS21S-2 TaxID=3068893 RepID=UPI0027B8B6F7|nr:hypothetical protein [Geothrix sp. 21YS21S-2]
MRRLLACFFVLSLTGAPPKPEACVQCHEQIDLARFHSRSHGGVSCVQCHIAIKALPHDEKLPPVRCERCHGHQGQEVAMSVHSAARMKDKTHAPTCSTCHGKAHDIVPRSNPESRVARRNMEATCGTCHPAGFLAKLSTRLPHRASRMAINPEDLK